MPNHLGSTLTSFNYLNYIIYLKCALQWHTAVFIITTIKYLTIFMYQIDPIASSSAKHSVAIYIATLSKQVVASETFLSGDE